MKPVKLDTLVRFSIERKCMLKIENKLRLPIIFGDLYCTGDSDIHIVFTLYPSESIVFYLEDAAEKEDNRLVEE